MIFEKVKISPSIIAGDLSTIGNDVKDFDPEIVDFLHIDVMDGNFVPNLTIGAPFIKALASHTSIPLDIHLMIERPEVSIDSYIALKPWALVFHYEATRFPARLLSYIRSCGIVAGISINPATSVENLFDLLEFCDLVLIMSVDPGFYGQSFMSQSLSRIERLKKQIDKDFANRIHIQVDGGINLSNIKSVVESGADIVVAGNSAFSGGNVNGNVAALKKAAIGN